MASALSAMMIIASMLIETLIETATARPASAMQKSPSQKKVAYYTCLMDPEIKARVPGKCPKCGMALKAVRLEPGPTAPADLSDKAVVSNVTDWTGSLRIPDTTIYDQDGKRLHFYTDLVKGKTVAINFIFTTCTTICPPMTANFRKVQQELGERVGGDIEMISISVDPVTDVPARMKDYTNKFNVGPGWTFVTGSKLEINELLKALGGYAGDRNNHTPIILVGNERAGYWTRTYGLASPTAIVNLINQVGAMGGDQSGKVGTTDGTSKESDTAMRVPLPGETGTAATERQIAKRTSASTAIPSSTKTDQPGSEGAKGRSATGGASYFPNLVLLTQDNQPVHFYDDLLKGKIVVINFIFTTCTGICPPMTANLAKVQSYLGDHVGREVNFISISVDPATDTPAEMKKYAARFKAKPGWYFLTGSKENVDQVLRKLGGYVEDKGDHSTKLIIGNEATGEWMKVFAMSKADEIANIIFKMIEPRKE
jgi:cytochrome oxidase Cu insertion factor (SCO1/SenC/PrrC family)